MSEWITVAKTQCFSLQNDVMGSQSEPHLCLPWGLFTAGKGNPSEAYFHKGEWEECPGGENLMSCLHEPTRGNVPASVVGLGTAHTVHQTALRPCTQHLSLTCDQGLSYESKYKLEEWDMLSVRYPQPWSQQLRHHLVKVCLRSVSSASSKRWQVPPSLVESFDTPSPETILLLRSRLGEEWSKSHTTPKGQVFIGWKMDHLLEVLRTLWKALRVPGGWSFSPLHFHPAFDPSNETELLCFFHVP